MYPSESQEHPQSGANEDDFHSLDDVSYQTKCSALQSAFIEIPGILSLYNTYVAPSSLSYKTSGFAHVDEMSLISHTS
jgi:hypothetical protein